MRFTPYVLPYIAAAVIVVASAPLLSKHRGVRGAGALRLSLVAATYWCLLNAVEIAGVSLVVKRTVANLEYLASWLPALWLIFCLQYTGRLGRLGPRRALLVSVVPVITNVLLWIPGHHLMRYDAHLVPGSPYIAVSYGPWFYVMTAYCYALMVGASGVVAESLARKHRLFRAQGLLMVLASAMPLIASGAHVLRLGPFALLDLTPAMFAIAMPILVVGVLRYRMLELVPAARATVIETMSDAIVVMDMAGRVVDANPAALRLLAPGGAPLLGRPVEGLVPGPAGRLLAEPAPGSAPVVAEMPADGRLMEVRLSPIREHEQTKGWLALFHDVTERETLIRDLQLALADKRALSGLIPICAACKRVRDDQGYWQQVETYLSDHSQVVFTHGICPECSAEFEREARRSRVAAAAGLR